MYDGIGNRSQTTVNGRTATYTPDNLNQFDERQVPRAIDVRGEAAASATVTVNGIATTRQGNDFFHDLDVSASGNGALYENVLVTAFLPDCRDGNSPRVADALASVSVKRVTCRGLLLLSR